MSDAFEQAFLAAVDDLNAGILGDPEHYLRTVPAARHEEFTRRLTALMAARGPAESDVGSAEAFSAAVAAVAAAKASDGQAGILPGALRQLRKARGIKRDAVLDALAAEYELGPGGRDELRRFYHQLESGTLVGPNIAHRLLRSLAVFFEAEAEDFIAAVRPARMAPDKRAPLRPAPAMGRGAGDESEPAGGSRACRPVGPDPEVELVQRLFTGGPDA